MIQSISLSCNNSWNNLSASPLADSLNFDKQYLH